LLAWLSISGSRSNEASKRSERDEKRCEGNELATKRCATCLLGYYLQGGSFDGPGPLFSRCHAHDKCLSCVTGLGQNWAAWKQQRLRSDFFFQIPSLEKSQNVYPVHNLKNSIFCSLDGGLDGSRRLIGQLGLTVQQMGGYGLTSDQRTTYCYFVKL
jgi:hypothetical protein